MKKGRYLLDEYRYPGFIPRARLKGIFGDPQARVITFVRRQKKRGVAAVAKSIRAIMIKKCAGYEICPAATNGYI
jgi:hypothetical protein